MSLLDRHVGLVHSLRGAGLPVSLAEGLDAVRALGAIGWGDRELVRAAYAATCVKREVQRPTFEALFDLWFPPAVGEPSLGTERLAEAEAAAADSTGGSTGNMGEACSAGGVKDSAGALAALREALARALADGDQQRLQQLAAEAVATFGAMPGRSENLAQWSSYTALRRLAPAELMARVIEALVGAGMEPEAAAEVAARRIGEWTARVEGDARRRLAETKGPDHVARHTVRPTIDTLDFLSARRGDLEQMRREIQPLARRLATRLTKEQHANGRGPLDFRRTVRASMATGGVPISTHHKPKRPHRNELVVLCDVSGSVANFAQFTLLLVFALREHFSTIRAFTFVDQIVEVTHEFAPGGDVVDTMERLTASIQHAALFGRTNYGRAFRTFAQEFGDALGPRSALLILGDARSNYADLQRDHLKEMAATARHAWWLNPEHRRSWDTGDSAAGQYGEIVDMVECRNLTQLSDFVHRVL